MPKRVIQAMLCVAAAACGMQSPANAQAFRTTPVATFDGPWAMAFLPGSGVSLTTNALVTEKNGRMWLVNSTNGNKQQVAGVPLVKVGGQGGLGDVVAHPGYAGNQRVYLSYVVAGPNNTSGAVIGYGQLVTGRGSPRLTNFKIIWRQEPKVDGNGHFGHRMAFAPDGTLFVTSGDRQKMLPAQDPDSDLGKVIHLNAEGQRIGGRSYSMGHRNPLGIAFAPDGRLWSTEMGPQGGDELNLIAQGGNYGWPAASYGSHYGGEDIPDDHAGRGYVEPKAWWNPSISPGSLLIYTGDLFPAWRGDALIGALSGQALLRVDIAGDTARKAEQWSMGKRIRAVDQGPRGEIYLLEDGTGGRLLRLEPPR